MTRVALAPCLACALVPHLHLNSHTHALPAQFGVRRADNESRPQPGASLEALGVDDRSIAFSLDVSKRFADVKPENFNPTLDRNRGGANITGTLKVRGGGGRGRRVRPVCCLWVRRKVWTQGVCRGAVRTTEARGCSRCMHALLMGSAYTSSSTGARALADMTPPPPPPGLPPHAGGPAIHQLDAAGPHDALPQAVGPHRRRPQEGRPGAGGMRHLVCCGAMACLLVLLLVM